MNAPNGWSQSAHIEWVSNNKISAIQLVLEKINSYKELKPTPLVLQLAYYLFLINDYQSAASLLSHHLQFHPNNIEILLNLAVCQSRSDLYNDAVINFRKVISIDASNYTAYDGLANSLHKIGNDKDAIIAGKRALDIKDSLVDNRISFAIPTIKPKQFASEKRNIISFSVWGNNPRYLISSARNILLLDDILPGWIARFYIDSSVPEDFVRFLDDFGAEIIIKDSNSTLKEKLTWRFLVSDDPTVGFFLIRDADSVISVRESIAINQWLESEKWFHVIRDNWTHTDLILAGLWGGVSGILPHMKTLIENYSPHYMETPNIDQWFLRDCIWSHIKKSCLIHDRFYGDNESPHLPDIFMNQNHHIGQNESATSRLNKQFNLIKLLSTEYPSLSLPT